MFIEIDGNRHINVFDIRAVYPRETYEGYEDGGTMIYYNGGKKRTETGLSVKEVMKRINKVLNFPENKEIVNRFEIMDI